MPPMTSLCLNELHTCKRIWKRQSIRKCRSPLSASTAIYLRKSLMAQCALIDQMISQSHQGMKVRDRSGKLAQTQHSQDQQDDQLHHEMCLPRVLLRQGSLCFLQYLKDADQGLRQTLGSQASANMASTTALSQPYSFQPASTNSLTQESVIA